MSKALHRPTHRRRATMAEIRTNKTDNPIRMGMDQEGTKPMSDTPIFTELNENMKQLRETAFRHGYLTAQVELIEYITEELKAKRLSPSKGVRNIVEKLTARE